MKRRRPPRHPFRFKIEVEGEKTRTITAWSTVRRARLPVDLILTADDVRRSIKLKGVGNTQTCSMAICAKRQEKSFPHPVEGGFIDWQYRAAFVVSKINKVTGLPTESYVYYHHDDIARLNDSKGGQKKLLDVLEAKGDRVIRLLPVRLRKPRPGRPQGQNLGVRNKHSSILGIGAKRRFAFATLGGIA